MDVAPAAPNTIWIMTLRCTTRVYPIIIIVVVFMLHSVHVVVILCWCELVAHEAKSWMVKCLKFSSHSPTSWPSKNSCSTIRQWVFCVEINIMSAFRHSVFWFWFCDWKSIRPVGNVTPVITEVIQGPSLTWTDRQNNSILPEKWLTGITLTRGSGDGWDLSMAFDTGSPGFSWTGL